MPIGSFTPLSIFCFFMILMRRSGTCLGLCITSDCVGILLIQFVGDIMRIDNCVDFEAVDYKCT